jgi:hypothetical protein
MAQPAASRPRGNLAYCVLANNFSFIIPLIIGEAKVFYVKLTVPLLFNAMHQGDVSYVGYF